MKKSFLEEKIEERAQKKYKQDLKNLHKFVEDNPIMKNLKIKIGDDEKKFMNLSGETGNVLFNGSTPQDALDLTNLKEIEETLIRYYKEEETNNLLNDLENINYLFNKQNND